MITDMLKTDFRHAVRCIFRAPGLSLIVILTLGVALASNLAIFGLLDKLVLQPLPVESPGELAIVSAPPLAHYGPSVTIGSRSNQNQSIMGVSYPLYTELRSRLTVFTDMLAQKNVRVTMLAGSEATQARGVLVTGNFFEILGIKAGLGRILTPEDDGVPGSHPIVVITHGFWQRQFGGDPSVLGRMIRINKIPMTIVGVSAAGFTGTVSGEATDFFAPLCMSDAISPIPGFTYDSQGYNIYSLMARLAPGVEWKQAEMEADRVYQQLLADSIRLRDSLTEKDRAILATQHAILLPGGYAFSQQSALSRNLTQPLTLLMAMVVLVLMVAAVNVGNLLLARNAARSHETAIRFALGSTRWRILRAHLWESLLLSSAAGATGLLLARWTAALVPAALSIESLPAGVTSAPDKRSAAAAAVLIIACGLGIWAASALRTTRRSALAALVGNAGIGRDRRALHWRRGMVVAQISLSLVLLCGSVVLSRSLVRLMMIDPGFPVENLYSFSINPGQAGYEGERAAIYLDQVLDQTGGFPGVSAASMTTQLPLSGGLSGTWMSSGDASSDDQRGLLVNVVNVGPSYFRTLGMPLIAGREFTRSDTPGTAKVAVLNESLARALFGDSDPLGRRVGFQGQPPDLLVVGVVRDTRTRTLRAPATPGLFLPHFQAPSGREITIVFRAAGKGTVTSEAVREAMRRLDPSVPVLEFGTLAARIDRSLYRDRMMASMSICFAGLASILCAIGVFGLSSFSVTRRTREIGVRLSLGATRGSIYWLLGREVALLFTAGSAIGLGIFVIAGGVLSSTLYELTPSDPASVAGATLLLAAVTFLAGFLPARRAARLDPACTLRQD